MPMVISATDRRRRHLLAPMIDPHEHQKRAHQRASDQQGREHRAGVVSQHPPDRFIPGLWDAVRIADDGVDGR